MLKKESALRKPGANFFPLFKFSQPSTINQGSIQSSKIPQKHHPSDCHHREPGGSSMMRRTVLKPWNCEILSYFFSKRMNLRNWQTGYLNKNVSTGKAVKTFKRQLVLFASCPRKHSKNFIEVHGVSRPHNHIHPYPIIFAQGGGPIYFHYRGSWILETTKKTHTSFFPDIRGFHPTKPRCNTAETRCRRDCLERPEGFDVSTGGGKREATPFFFWEAGDVSFSLKTLVPPSITNDILLSFLYKFGTWVLRRSKQKLQAIWTKGCFIWRWAMWNTASPETTNRTCVISFCRFLGFWFRFQSISTKIDVQRGASHTLNTTNPNNAP